LFLAKQGMSNEINARKRTFVHFCIGAIGRRLLAGQYTNANPGEQHASGTKRTPVELKIKRGESRVFLE
jgi:hypothetical protein